MRQGVMIGHLMRIPVFVETGIIFTVIFVYMITFRAGIEVFLLCLTALVITVLLHELGHALVARAKGMMGVTISLSALGGYCSYAGEPRWSDKILISAAGPATNFLVMWAAMMLQQLLNFPPDASGRPDLIMHLLHYLVLWNFFLGIFNSIPIYPLDGGQIALALSGRYSANYAAAKKTTLFISVASAVAVFLLYEPVMGHPPGTFTLVIVAMLVFTAFQHLR